MADEEVKPSKPVTRAQMGTGIGVMAALAMVGQMKSFFVPVEKAASQDKQIETLDKRFSDLDSSTDKRFAEFRDDFTHKLERSTDKIIDRIKESEDRTSRAADTTSRRIDTLEAVILRSPGKSHTN